MGVVAGILILSYYSVVAGWTLAYVPKSIAGAFTGASAEEVEAIYNEIHRELAVGHHRAHRLHGDLR